MTTRPTQEIIAGVLAGDLEKFEELYGRMAPALQTWIRLSIRPNMRGFVDPADVMQEVWLRGLSKISSYSSERASFRAWIFGIAKKIMLEVSRDLSEPAAQAAARGLTRSMFVDRAEEATEILDRLERDESLAAMAATLASLETEERQLVVWCGLEGLSHREVGRRLDVKENTITKRWERLRRDLASRLPEWGHWA